MRPVHALAAIFFAGASAFAAPPIEQETLARLDALRAITTGPAAKPVEEYNRQMDEAWKFFSQHRAEVLPILSRELVAETNKPNRSDMILLDIGHFLSMQNDAGYRALAKAALLALDPQAIVVQWNFQELFDFTYRFAGDQDPAMLLLFDRAFLPSEQKVFVPQHAMALGGTLMSVFLYGKRGHDAESHLASLLGDAKLRNRILEVLQFIGSPESIPQVKASLVSHPDADTLARAILFLLNAGGPEGQAAVLSVDASKLDPKAKSFYDAIAPRMKGFTGMAIHAELAQRPGYKKLSDDEVRARLDAMVAHEGKDDETHPLAIVDSGLPRDYLIGKLIEIRRLTFYRLSGEALDDVRTTNALISVLRYR